MTIESNYSMQRYILDQGPEQKYRRALEILRDDNPGITSQALFSLVCMYIKIDPSDVYMSNEAREAFLGRTFVELTLPIIPSRSAVSILQSCDIHLESLVFTSFGYPAGKFSSLVLPEYSKILSPTPIYKLGDSTEENFNKSPVGRLLAIKAVFEKYLRNPRITSPGWKELSGVHADYDRVKKQFSQLLELQGLGGLSPQRSITPPTSPFPSPPSLGDEVRILLAGDSSPERIAERRALIQSRVAARFTRSPPSEAEAAFQTAAAAESFEKLIPPTVSSTLPAETTVPATPVSSPVEKTTKPTVEVVTRPRVLRRTQLVVTGTAARALEAATNRSVRLAADGKIICTIRK
jgi:hypothetical protein